MDKTAVTAIRKILSDAHRNYPAYFCDSRNTSALLADLLYEQEEELREAGFSLLDSSGNIGGFYYRILRRIRDNRYDDDIGNQLYAELMHGRERSTADFIAALIEAAMESEGKNGTVFRWLECPVCGTRLHSYEKKCGTCRTAFSDFDRLPDFFDQYKKKLQLFSGDPSIIAKELAGFQWYTAVSRAGQYAAEKQELEVLLMQLQMDWQTQQVPAKQPPPVTNPPPPAPAPPGGLTHESFTEIMGNLFGKQGLWPQILPVSALVLSTFGTLLTYSAEQPIFGGTLQNIAFSLFFLLLLPLTVGKQGTKETGKRWRFIVVLLQLLMFRLLRDCLWTAGEDKWIVPLLFVLFDLIFLFSDSFYGKTDGIFVWTFLLFTQINLSIYNLFPVVRQGIVRNFRRYGILLERSVKNHSGLAEAVYPVGHTVLGLGVLCLFLILSVLIFRKMAKGKKTDGCLPTGGVFLLFCGLLNGVLMTEWQISYRVIGTFAAVGIVFCAFLLTMHASPGGKLYLVMLAVVQMVCCLASLHPETWRKIQSSLHKSGAKFGEFLSGSETKGGMISFFDGVEVPGLQILAGVVIVLGGAYAAQKLINADMVYHGNALYLGIHAVNFLGMLYVGLPVKTMLTTAAALLTVLDMCIVLPYLMTRKVYSAATVLLIALFFQIAVWTAVFVPALYGSLTVTFPFLQNIFDMIGVRSYEAMSFLS